jgi:hypothetical protein
MNIEKMAQPGSTVHAVIGYMDIGAWGLISCRNAMGNSSNHVMARVLTLVHRDWLRKVKITICNLPGSHIAHQKE